LKLNPRDPERRERFCEMGALTKQYEQIVTCIRTWLEEDGSDALATSWLIDVLLSADRAEEALEVARKFEGTYAESFERRIWLGRCEAGKGEIAKALEEFDELLNERLLRDSQRRDVWEQIARVLLREGRFDDLLARCEGWLAEAEQVNPALRPIALHLKRQALQLAGRDPESAEVMEALLSYVPVIADVLDDQGYNSGLFNDLGYVWADLGLNLERAGDLIRLAVAAEPWNAAFLDSLGWVYYKTGDFSNARKYLGRAARLRDGRDPVVYDHLADAGYRLGDREAARDYWNQAVSLLETELSEGEQARRTDLLAKVRAKLATLERSETPTVAPTAAEQHKDESKE
jgi:tetratricopeptide (TPR) repeat protein